MFLALSGIFFATMFANVVMGTLGMSIFLTDVQEMLVLFAAAICFVVDILKREARRNNSAK